MKKLSCFLLFSFVVTAGNLYAGKPLLVVQTFQSGNWSDPATWQGGNLPGQYDEVIINSGHSVLMDMVTTTGKVQVQTGAMLQLTDASDTLSIGSMGGGNGSLVINGSLVVNNGTILLGGNLSCLPGSSFMMTGGRIRVDGNDGTSAGSVVAGTDMVSFSAGMTSFQFTGGTLNIVDPPYNNTGLILNSAYDFGANSTLRLGDSIYSHYSPAVHRFGKNLPSVIGHLQVYIGTGGISHYFRLMQPLKVLGNCTIEKGNYLQHDYFSTASFHVADSFRIEGDFVVRNSLTVGVWDTAIVSAPLSIGGDLVVDSGVEMRSIYESKVSVNGDVHAMGILGVHYLYMADNFGQSPSQQPQKISGRPDYFSWVLGELFINNSSAGGVTLDSTGNSNAVFRLQRINFIQGKFFAGNQTVDLGWNMLGGNAGSYLVLDTGGTVEISGSPVEVYIGPDANSYNPVRITSYGHLYEIGVRPAAITQSGTSGIHVQWDIRIIGTQNSPLDITFQWSGNQEDPGFHRNSCYVAKYNGSLWQSITPWLPAEGTDPYIKKVTGLTSLSAFSIRSSDILPIQLLDFSAVMKGDIVYLQWSADHAVNFSHFEVEGSTDGASYKKLGRVEGYAGRHDYTYMDPVNFTGPRLYRLKMVDLDGSFAYGPVVKINIERASVMVYPNPVASTLHISGIHAGENIIINDAMGRQVLAAMAKDTYIQIDVQLWKAGIYYIQLKQSGKIFSVIKN